MKRLVNIFENIGSLGNLNHKGAYVTEKKIGQEKPLRMAEQPFVLP